MARTHTVRLTGPQLRVLHELLSIIGNDPDWAEQFGERDWQTLGRATDVIVAAHVDACRAESTPAASL
jgi:hypothetical protein